MRLSDWSSDVFSSDLVGRKTYALRALPAQLGHVAGANLEQPLGFGAIFMAQPGHQRAHRLGLQVIENVLRQNSRRQTRGGNPNGKATSRASVCRYGLFTSVADMLQNKTK